jgi:hypothetical protein
MNSLFAYLPLLVCGASGATIWKCFKEVEAIAKAQFRQQITRAIQTSSIFTVGTMFPTLCISAFDALFTERLWSWRGFVRSCVASFVMVIILMVVWYSTIPDEWRVRVVGLAITDHPESPRWWTLIAIPHYKNVPFNLDVNPQGQFSTIPGDILRQGGTLTFALNIQGVRVFGGLPFIYNLIVDFCSLIVTRRILQHISEQPSPSLWRVMITFFFVCLRDPCVVLCRRRHCHFISELYLFRGNPFDPTVGFNSEQFCRSNLISVL